MEILRSFEYGVSPLALPMLVVYRTHLVRKMSNAPLNTAQGLTSHTRKLWVQSISRN